MQFVQIPGRHSLCVAALLAVISTGSQAQAEYSLDALHQALAANSNGFALVANRLDAVSATASGSFSSGFAGFDVSRGVLVGVSATLQVTNPATTFLQTFSEERHEIDASFSSNWILSSAAGPTVQTGNQTLISLIAGNDKTFLGTNQWSQTALTQTVSGAALNTFVADKVTSTTSSTVGIAITDFNPSNGRPTPNGSLQAFLHDSGSPFTGSSTFSDATVDVTYSYLEHASVGLGTSDLNRLDANTRSVDVLVIGQSGSTTDSVGFDFDATGGVQCSDDDGVSCKHFTFAPDADSFANIAAGTELKLGSVSLLDTAGTYRARYSVTIWDTAEVGASLSRRSQTVSFGVESGAVTAVPEPHGAAMLLAGLGAIGWMSRRRRSTRDQVAKL